MRAIHCPRAGRALAVAALLSISGCATKGDLRNVRDEIRGLAERQDDVLMALQRQASVTQDSLRGTSNQLLQIRGSVSNQLDQIMDALETIRELSGQNQRAIAGIRDQLESLRRQVQMGVPSGTGFPEGADPSREGGQAGAADAMYNAGVMQYNRGSWTSARSAFEQFLAAYPNDELAPEARYKLADILVQEGQRQEAIRAFEQIPELHPTAPKVPDALYRIALLQIDLGNRNDARRTLERVVNSYPDSPVTPLAQEKLREIRR